MIFSKTLWKIEKERLQGGRYLNSPVRATWCECGVIRAADRNSAMVKACFTVGSSRVRVSPVPDFYRPSSLI